MTHISLYLTTAVLFLVIDAIMLSTVIGPVFRSHLGDAMYDSPRLGPAAVFYLFYVLGVVILISGPALADNAPLRALWQGALLGAVAYGTYEWTNFSTLKDWSMQMVALDWAWGTVLTGFTAWAGVSVTRAIFS